MDDIDGYPVPLSTVLSTPYQLIYAIILLVLSFPLTFAGAFLTLDRTRSFAPAEKQKLTAWRFEGGVGGLIGGWVFGMHLSTFLSLLIMNRTTSKPLGEIQFLIIWILSAAALSVLCGRFKYAAVTLTGLGGGVAFALFTVVVCHPSQNARSIVLGIFASISAILCLIPVPVVQHGALRASAAWLGALGIIISISILAKYSSWADAWSRLWLSWSSNWGTGEEKGLSAAFAGLAAVGAAVDYALKRFLGENPDEKWDSYLATYASNLPNSHDRPGNFTPDVPFWKRVFNPPPKPPILYPPDKVLLSSPPKLANNNPRAFRPLKTHDDFSSDSDSDDGGIPRPWAKRRRTSTSKVSLSGATLAGSDPSNKDKGKAKSVEVDYSDGESVSLARKNRPRTSRDAPGWTPEFLSQRQKEKERDLERGDVNSDGGKDKEKPSGAVPMTPSLLKALDRITQAQGAAYGGSSAPGTPASPGAGGGTGYDWGAFWRNVEDKAKESDQQQQQPQSRRPTGLS